ncbi:MAG: methyltransferase MtaB domain-containing protein, partial [bacterium]
PRPVTCGSGLRIGVGTVYPEIKFTLPPMRIDEQHMAAICEIYRKTISAVLERAVALSAPGVVVEFEHLPEMTRVPAWGEAITRVLREAMDAAAQKDGLRTALRVTPVDIRESRNTQVEFEEQSATLLESFRRCAAAGADLLAIESTGGKEISDQALMECDLRGLMRGLVVVGTEDCGALWREIKKIADAAHRHCIPSGDSACGFANTAMVLAERGYIPRVFAAMVRVISAVRSLAAFENGAVGPSKDCAYEGVICKAVRGVPISMEGKSAAFAHLSSIGNIASAATDLWSNESIEVGRALSGEAVVANFEQLVYDCRLMNTARERGGEEGARQFRDWLVMSDAPLDPQAWVLNPEFVVQAAEVISRESDPYSRAYEAAVLTLNSISRAIEDQELQVPDAEIGWLEQLRGDLEDLPESAADL